MKRLLLAAAALAIAATASFADPVEDREALMKSFGAAVGKLAPIAKGEQPFDEAAVLTALETLNTQIQKFDANALFPEGSIGDSRALPAIWVNWDDFVARHDKFQADVADAVANPPADQKALGATLGKIGGNCAGCHENYRKTAS